MRCRPLHLVLVLVASVAALVTSLSAPGTADAHPWGDRPVRVLTYNIHHGVGSDGALDLRRIAATIRAGRPDVVGLQEVDRHFDARSDFADQPRELARLLGMHVVFGANLDEPPAGPGRPRRQYGTAILSRYPILQWHNTYLPKVDDHEQRGLLEARILVRDRLVRMYDTHLEASNGPEREQQSAAILRLVHRSPEPTVLVGDLNAEVGAPEVDALTARFADVWAEAGDGPGYTYETGAPTKRIDFVLTSHDVRAHDVRVLDSVASDHLPVAAGLRVR